MKGVRIQSIVRELEGEKIDILKYDNDPRVFIKNALSPAEVDNVYILDESKRQAMAVVKENQLSLAIGKQGLNVRLANRLVDWNIDVKTEEQFAELDYSERSKQELNALFGEYAGEEPEEITNISELPGISERLSEILTQNGIELIEDLISMSSEELSKLEGITSGDVEKIQSTIADNLDIIEESEEAAGAEYEEAEEAEEEEEEEVYECPECGHQITIDMTTCPNCGVGLSFEIEEEEQQEE
jgi:N utilization substance protein A